MSAENLRVLRVVMQGGSSVLRCCVLAHPSFKRFFVRGAVGTSLAVPRVCLTIRVVLPFLRCCILVPTLPLTTLFSPDVELERFST